MESVHNREPELVVVACTATKLKLLPQGKSLITDQLAFRHTMACCGMVGSIMFNESSHSGASHWFHSDVNSLRLCRTSLHNLCHAKHASAALKLVTQLQYRWVHYNIGGFITTNDAIRMRSHYSVCFMSSEAIYFYPDFISARIID